MRGRVRGRVQVGAKWARAFRASESRISAARSGRVWACAWARSGRVQVGAEWARVGACIFEIRGWQNRQMEYESQEKDTQSFKTTAAPPFFFFVVLLDIERLKVL